MASYRLNKICPICGKLLMDKNKTGFCNIHFPRSGKNNPFFGKHHTKETIESNKIKCRQKSKEKWSDPDYRNSVIKGMTGKKRSEEFKETQRQNALKQFQDQHQRDIRSSQMHESWVAGKIVKTKNLSYNKSKQEIRLINELIKKFGEIVVVNENIPYFENNKKRFLLPDCIISNVIIEYNGSYWHADPRRYNGETIIHHNKTAKQIWGEDDRKRKIYNNLGYTVIYVWSDDFLYNHDNCISQLIDEIELCLKQK